MTRTTWNHIKNPDAPLRWRKPRLVRVNLTGAETDAELDRMMATMDVSPRSCFQLLAPIGRMHKYLTGLTVDGGPVPARWDDARRPAYNAVHWRQREYIGILGAYPKWPLPNVAIGTTCRTQAEVDHAVPLLLSMPNAGPWLRLEPSEGISIARWTEYGLECSSCKWTGCEDQSKQVDFHDEPGGWACHECGEPCAHTPIDETIDAPPSFLIELSGQTGPDAQPLHPQWARQIRDDCKAANVPFRFESWGEWATIYDRDRDDPDWTLCSHISNKHPHGRWLNNTGGHGFHGQHVVYVTRVGPRRSGRTLDVVEHGGQIS